MRSDRDFLTPRNGHLSTLSGLRKVQLVTGFWVSLALTIWAVREFTG